MTTRLSIVEASGGDYVNRPGGMRLRGAIEARWAEGDDVEVDFGDLRVASASFLDEGIAHLALTHPIPFIRTRLKLVNIRAPDRRLLNQLIGSRAQERTPKEGRVFPSSDPRDIRKKLETFCPPGRGSTGVHLSYSPLIYLNRRFYGVPMVHHGNIAKVDDDGVLMDMGGNANPHAGLEPVALPLLQPTLEAPGPFFSAGLPLRIPYSAIIDAWASEGPQRLVNLWLRHAVVMTQGWSLIPFVWAPEVAERPG